MIRYFRFDLTRPHQIDSELLLEWLDSIAGDSADNEPDAIIIREAIRRLAELCA